MSSRNFYKLINPPTFLRFADINSSNQLKESMKYESELNEYLSGIELLKNKVKEFDSDSFTYKPSPDKWSIQEIIIHLADAEMNASTRMRKIIAESGSSIIPYEQDNWAEKLNYNSQNAEQYIGLFALLRDINFRLMKALPDGAWENFVNHPESGKITLKRWLDIYNNHLKNHLKQMEECYNAWKQRK